MRSLSVVLLALLLSACGFAPISYTPSPEALSREEAAATVKQVLLEQNVPPAIALAGEDSILTIANPLDSDQRGPKYVAYSDIDRVQLRKLRGRNHYKIQLLDPAGAPLMEIDTTDVRKAQRFADAVARLKHGVI